MTTEAITRRPGFGSRGGRLGPKPKTISDDQLPELERMAADGQRKIDIAAVFNMSADTFRRVLRDEPKVLAAWDRGRGKLHHEISNLLIERARSGDLTAIIFSMKCFFGYRDHGTSNDDDSAAPLVSITLPGPMTAEQYRAKLDDAKRSLTITTRPRGTDQEGGQ